jgi:hypothetical protein
LTDSPGGYRCNFALLFIPGLSATLAGPTPLAAILGGLILQAAGYRVLFLLTLAILLIAQTLASGLPEPRRLSK